MKKFVVIVLGLVLVLAACGAQETPGGGATQSEAETIYNRSCIGCHGSPASAGRSGPSLKGVGDRYNQEQIADIIVNGKGRMARTGLNQEQAMLVAEWLLAQ